MLGRRSNLATIVKSNRAVAGTILCNIFTLHCTKSLASNKLFAFTLSHCSKVGKEAKLCHNKRYTSPHVNAVTEETLQTPPTHTGNCSLSCSVCRFAKSQAFPHATLAPNLWESVRSDYTNQTDRPRIDAAAQNTPSPSTEQRQRLQRGLVVCCSTALPLAIPPRSTTVWCRFVGWWCWMGRVRFSLSLCGTYVSRRKPAILILTPSLTRTHMVKEAHTHARSKHDRLSLVFFRIKIVGGRDGGGCDQRKIITTFSPPHVPLLLRTLWVEGRKKGVPLPPSLPPTGCIF